jgi:hypothetical protein
VDAEKVQMIVSLKFGERVYLKGTILTAPFPAEIVSELRANASVIPVLRTISIIERKQDEPPKASVPIIPDIVEELPPTPDIVKELPKVPIPPPPAGKPKRGRRKKLK